MATVWASETTGRNGEQASLAVRPRAGLGPQVMRGLRVAMACGEVSKTSATIAGTRSDRRHCGGHASGRRAMACIRGYPTVRKVTASAWPARRTAGDVALHAMRCVAPDDRHWRHRKKVTGLQARMVAVDGRLPCTCRRSPARGMMDCAVMIPIARR